MGPRISGSFQCLTPSRCRFTTKSHDALMTDNEINRIGGVRNSREARVAERECGDEIKEMEVELTGYRRIASDSLTPSCSGDIPSRARVQAPPIFTGKRLGELQRHLQGAIIYFNDICERDEARRVATAVSYLREDTLSQ